MKGLLDTHTLLWWDHEAEKLSPRVLSFCQDPANTLLVSVASVWELQIKVVTGKLVLRDPLAALVERQERNAVTFVPVDLAHIYALGALPIHHKDPFDRLIIAQAIVAGATLLSADLLVALYAPAVTVLW